jgi:hypothetical protein
MLKPETKKTKQDSSSGRRRATVARPAEPNIAKENGFTREQVAERAYFIWTDKGQPADQDVACWCEAEAELRARCSGIEDEADDA